MNESDRDKSYKFAVCIKQVPKEDAQIDWKTGRLDREHTELVLNPDDYHALQFAADLKKQYGGVIDVYTLGPPQAEEVLREAYAYGADKCFLLTDPVFAGSDTLITSKILSQALQKNGPYDVVITGKKSTDGDTGHVSYQLAEYLNISHLTRIRSFNIVEGKTIRVERIYGHEFQIVQTKMPVLVAVDSYTNTLGYPHILNVKRAFTLPITIITHEDLGGIPEDYGLEASPTITLEGSMVQHKRKNIIVEGSFDDKIDFVIKKLRKYNLIGY